MCNLVVLMHTFVCRVDLCLILVPLPINFTAFKELTDMNETVCSPTVVFPAISTVVASTPVTSTVVASTPVTSTAVDGTPVNMPMSSVLTPTITPSTETEKDQGLNPTIIATISAVVVTTALVIIAALGLCILMWRKRSLDRKILHRRDSDDHGWLGSASNPFARLSVSLAEKSVNLPLTDHNFPVSRPMSVVSEAYTIIGMYAQC